MLDSKGKILSEAKRVFDEHQGNSNRFGNNGRRCKNASSSRTLTIERLSRPGARWDLERKAGIPEGPKLVRRKDGMPVVEISCVEVWREISNYVDDEISPELRERLEAHFRVCAHCKAVLDGTQNVVSLIGDGRVFAVPKGFSDRLYRKIKTVL